MSDIYLPVTTAAALANGTLFLVLTLAVVRMRRRDKVVLGDNGNRALAKRIRAQGNAAEQMPIALIMMALAEAQGAACLPLAALAGLFTLGRVSHGAYFALDGLHWRFRLWGMTATSLAQIGLLLTLAAMLIA